MVKNPHGGFNLATHSHGFALNRLSLLLAVFHVTSSAYLTNSSIMTKIDRSSLVRGFNAVIKLMLPMNYFYVSVTTNSLSRKLAHELMSLTHWAKRAP